MEHTQDNSLSPDVRFTKLSFFSMSYGRYKMCHMYNNHPAL